MTKGAIFKMAYHIYGAEKRFKQILMTFSETVMCGKYAELLKAEREHILASWRKKFERCRGPGINTTSGRGDFTHKR